MSKFQSFTQVTIEGEALEDIFLEGQPVPAERVRKGTGNRWYVPKKTLEFRKRFTEAAYEAWNGAIVPWKGPVAILSHFYRKGKRRVDVDNLQKSIQDALIGVAYMDDSQVEVVVAMKSTVEENPFTIVRVVRLGKVKVTEGKI